VSGGGDMLPAYAHAGDSLSLQTVVMMLFCFDCCSAAGFKPGAPDVNNAGGSSLLAVAPVAFLVQRAGSALIFMKFVRIRDGYSARRRYIGSIGRSLQLTSVDFVTLATTNLLPQSLLIRAKRGNIASSSSQLLEFAVDRDVDGDPG
jgi:hypothetical protein